MMAGKERAGGEVRARRPRGRARSLRAILAFAGILALVSTAGTAWGYFSASVAQTNTFVAGQISPATNFAAGSITSSSVSLGWTVPAEPAGATITNWTMSQTPAAGTGCGGNQPTNPCTVTGLSAGTTYTWTLTYYVGGWQALTTVSAATLSAAGTFAGMSAPATISNSENNVIVSYPTGTAAGDLVLLVIANNATQLASFSAAGNSTGWADVSTAGAYPPQQNGGVGQQTLQVFWHQAGTETSVDVRIQTSARGATAWVLDYKGLATPIALAGTTVFGTADNVSSLSQGALTTTANNALVVSFAEITASATPPIPSLATANGFTRHVATSAGPPGSAWVALGVADRPVGTAGSVTAPVWETRNAGNALVNSQWAYITVAFI